MARTCDCCNDAILFDDEYVIRAGAGGCATLVHLDCALAECAPEQDRSDPDPGAFGYWPGEGARPLSRAQRDGCA